MNNIFINQSPNLPATYNDTKIIPPSSVILVFYIYFYSSFFNVACCLTSLSHFVYFYSFSLFLLIFSSININTNFGSVFFENCKRILVYMGVP